MPRPMPRELPVISACFPSCAITPPGRKSGSRALVFRGLGIGGRRGWTRRRDSEGEARGPECLGEPWQLKMRARRRSATVPPLRNAERTGGEDLPDRPTRLEVEERDAAQPVVGPPVGAERLHELRERLVLLVLCDVQIIDRDAP